MSCSHIALRDQWRNVSFVTGKASNDGVIGNQTKARPYIDLGGGNVVAVSNHPPCINENGVPRNPDLCSEPMNIEDLPEKHRLQDYEGKPVMTGFIISHVAHIPMRGGRPTASDFLSKENLFAILEHMLRSNPHSAKLKRLKDYASNWYRKHEHRKFYRSAAIAATVFKCCGIAMKAVDIVAAMMARRPYDDNREFKLKEVIIELALRLILTLLLSWLEFPAWGFALVQGIGIVALPYINKADKITYQATKTVAQKAWGWVKR